MNKTGFRFSTILVSMMIMAVVIPAISIGVLLTRTVYEEIISSSEKQLQAELAAISERLKADFSGLKNQISYLALHDDLRLSLDNEFMADAGTRQLSQFSSEQGNISEAYLTNLDGALIASSKEDLFDLPDHLSSDTLSKKTGLVPYQSEFYWIESIRKTEDGKVTDIGRLILKMDLEKLLRSGIDNVRRKEAQVVVSGVNTNFSFILESPLIKNDSKLFEQERRVSIFQKLDVTLKIADLHDAKMQRANSQVNIALFIIIALVLAIAGFAVFVSKRMTRPIDDLTMIAKKYSEGDYQSKPRSSGFTEFQTLSGAFSRMVDQILSQLKSIELSFTRVQKINQHGKLIASQLGLKGLVKELHTALQETIMLESAEEQAAQISIYFSKTCFKDQSLEEGFYPVCKEGKAQKSSKVRLTQLQGRKCLFAVDLRTQEMLAAVTFENIHIELMLKLQDSFNAFLVNASSAITTVRLEQTFTLLESKSAQIISIFENIEQGICLINGKYNILPDYSIFLTNILEEKELKGKNLISLLQQKTSITKEQLSHIDSIIANYEEGEYFNFEINKAHLPNELTFINKTKEKIVEIEWIPILNSDQEIGKMMLTFRDVTKVRELQNKANQNKELMENILLVSGISSPIFEDIMEKASELFGDQTAFIKFKSPGSIQALKQRLHALKGNSRILGFGKLSSLIHEMESTVDNNEDHSESIELCGAISTHLDKLKMVNEDILGRSGKTDSEKIEILDDILHTVHSLHEKNPSNEILHIESKLYSLFDTSFERIIARALKGLESVADELGMAKPRFHLNLPEKMVFTDHGASVLFDILVQIIKNTLDHGCEKNDIANIGISVPEFRSSENLIIYYNPNDKGLDMPKLAYLAQKNEFEHNSDEELAHIIFESGISTSERVTEISGRGVGMDLVLDRIKRLKGEIKVQFIGPRDQKGFRKFSLKITLPKTVLRSSVPYIDNSNNMGMVLNL